MAFVLHTVASILRGNDRGDDAANKCCCHRHPNRCCHKADYGLLSHNNSIALSTLKYVNARTCEARERAARVGTSAAT